MKNKIMRFGFKAATFSALLIGGVWLLADNYQPIWNFVLKTPSVQFALIMIFALGLFGLFFGLMYWLARKLMDRLAWEILKNDSCEIR